MSVSRIGLMPKGLPLMSLIGGAALAASSVWALAADWPGSRPPPPSPPRYTPAEPYEFSGWYVRGDINYLMLKAKGAQAAPGFVAPTDNKFDATVSGGLGAGYKSGWFRADVTVDTSKPTNYSGTVATPGDTRARVTATTALLNGYLDLGSWYRITPYVGAGAGIANMYIYDYASTGSPPFTGDTSRRQNNFAWAAMAGVSYAVTSTLLVDAGYRYLNLGDVTTANDTFGNMRLEKLNAHEVRVGLRWNFEDAPLGR